METAAAGAPQSEKTTPMRTVIVASAAGTAFEWYDFFVYGSLTSIISRKFFAGLDETAGTLATLALFAVGLVFRPVGALIFGRIGDTLGRKGAFLMTVIIMGGATFAIGLLPDNNLVGGASTVALIVLRILQGMAVGGEYGGAAIYVAEHAPADRRGATTAWIQSSAAFGLVGALGIVLMTRSLVGEEAMFDWGWRVPFLASAFLLAISIWMRLKLNESPEFTRMKEEGTVSKAPYREAFAPGPNLRNVLIILVTLLLAQGPLWYSEFFYTQIFLENFTKVPGFWSNLIMIGAVLFSIPCYIFFARLSDKVGRKPVMLAGMAVSTIAMFPAFMMMANGANGALFKAQEQSPVSITADQSTCSFKIDLLNRLKPQTGCDIARKTLISAGVSYTTENAPAGTAPVVHIGGTSVPAPDATGSTGADLTAKSAEIDKALKAALKDAGYPLTADPANFNWVMIVIPFIVLVLAATALYGPMAAALVELFPARVRYTALSVPYHLCIGVVGGLMPAAAFAIATASGNIFSGLWYPVVFGAIATVCTLLFYPETKGKQLS